MKFSQATLLAILATATFAASAPTETPQFNTEVMVTRQDANELLDILSQLEHIHAKRELAEGAEFAELSERADSLIGQLITALANSGIIGEVWTTLTTNSQVSSIVGGLIKSAIQGAIVQGPALILAIWNSGLIGNVWNTLISDTELQSAFFALAKSLFSSAASLLLNFGSGSTTTAAAAAPAPAATTAAAAAAPAAPAAYKREFSIEATKRHLSGLSESDILDKRDLSSLITTIVNAIANSGIVTTMVNYVLANPQQSISLLESALSTGVVVFEDVYNWAKSSGILQEGLTWIGQNGGAIVSELGTFLANALTSGTVTASQINNAAAPATTAVATTAAYKREYQPNTMVKRMLY